MIFTHVFIIITCGLLRKRRIRTVNIQRIGGFFKRYGHIFWILVLAFIFVTICSKCSFLYPFNDWPDANVYFTIGKGMVHGKVLYRDLFDHKGFYIYALHSIAYLISNDTFIGMYLFELIVGFFYGFAFYKILTLYTDRLHAVLFMPVLLFVTYVAQSFCHGDSAEELMLPMLAFSLYYLLQFAKGQKLHLYKYAVVGAFAALAFWIKFTLCGLFFGWILLAFIYEVIDKNVKHALVGAGLFVSGFLVVTLPVIIYFGANEAFGELWHSYFAVNLFGYSGGEPTPLGESGSFFGKIIRAVYGYLTSICYGYLYYLAIIPGLLAFLISKGYHRREKVVISVLYILTNLLIYAGGKRYTYYGLPSAIFAVTGFIALCNLSDFGTILTKPNKKFFATVSVMLAVLCGLTFFVSSNIEFMFKKKKNLVQYRFAEIIKQTPDATLLNYDFIDLGLYTTTGIIPDCKYFFRPNLTIPEIMEMQKDIVANGKVDYVFCIELKPENIDDHYELAAPPIKQKLESNEYTYYLYKLKD